MALAMDEAIRVVDLAADENWKAAADAVMEHLARTLPELTTDQVWAGLATQFPGEDTQEHRAMSGVVTRARTKGLIEKTDRTIDSEREECHRNPKRVWKSLVYTA